MRKDVVVLRIENIFHTGVVVPDVHRAIVEYSKILNTEWTEPVDRTLSLRGPSGPYRIDIALAYTRRGPHYIELVQAVADSLWEQPSGSAAAHHTGVWSDDLTADSAALEAAGSPLLATVDDGSSNPRHWAYHRLANGTLIELVDASRRAALERWFAGGSFS